MRFYRMLCPEGRTGCEACTLPEGYLKNFLHDTQEEAETDGAVLGFACPVVTRKEDEHVL